MTPIDKALAVFTEGAFDTQKVLKDLLVLYPQAFLQAASNHKCKVSQVPTATLKARVDNLIHVEGKYVNAIKMVREETGRGLREAKDYCDEIRGPNRPIQRPDFMPSQKDLMLTLLRRNQPGDKVRVVKYIREITGLSLKEAKGIMDTMSRNL